MFALHAGCIYFALTPVPGRLLMQHPLLGFNVCGTGTWEILFEAADSAVEVTVSSGEL